MATALLAPGPLALVSNPASSVGLRNASVALPTVDASVVIPGTMEAPLAGVLADPRPSALAFSGVSAPVEDLAIFDRIHVIPRSRDLGAVISEQQVEVEVWNAFHQRAQILEDITVEGTSGVSVVDHLGLPAHFAGSASEIYIVQVAATGDPNVNNLVTWLFTGISELGTDMLLVGVRILPVPFDFNWDDPVVEIYGYLTDIITAYDGTEQRRQLRTVPVGSIGFSIALRELRDVQMANAILFGYQPYLFGIPKRQDAVRLTQEASAGTSLVYCPTEHIPFEVGGLVYLWRDPYTWEAQTIEEVNADHLVLAIGLANTWPAGTLAMPMVTGRLSQDEALTWESLDIGSQALVFTVEGFRP